MSGWNIGGKTALDLALNPPAGSINFQQFGTASMIQTSSPPMVVWNGFQIDGLTAYLFSATAAIDTISSSDANDTELLLILGLDAARNWHSQVVTLNGQTKVTLGTPLIRVNRILNIGTVNIAGVVRLYEDTVIVAGVPTDKSKVRGYINGNQNISQQAVFSCPLNLRCILFDTYANIGEAGTASDKEADVQTKFTPLGSVAVAAGQFTVNSTGTSKLGFVGPVPVELPAGGDLVWTINAVSNNNSTLNAGFNFFLLV